MTSKLVVNTIEADTGISSVSFASSISMSSTSKFHFSNAGIDIGADTNINRPASGVLAFNINSSEKVRILSDGRVGVGTNNPHSSYRFDIRHSADNILHLGQGAATLAGMANDSWNAISFQGTNCEFGLYKDGSGNFSYIMGTYQGGTAIPIIFRTGNRQERLRIDSSGRVLMGTTTEGSSSADDLTIATTGTTGITLRSGTGNAGNIEFSDGTSGTDEYRGIVQYHHSDNSMRFFTDAERRVTIDSSGRLLIGTTTEGHSNADNLTVASSGETGITIRSGTSSQSSLYFSDATTGTGEYAGSVVYNHSNNKLFLATSSSNRLTIDSSGLMGVGTQSPQKNLHLYSSGVATLRIETGDSRGQAWDILSTNGSQNNTGTLSFRDESGSSYVEFGANEGSPQFRVRNGGANDLLHIDSSGRVTKPNHPMFEVTTTGGQNLTNNTREKIIFNNVVTQRGVSFDTSNHRFTAPVAGYYHFDLFVYTYYSRFVECDSRINGASTGSKVHRLTTYVNPTDQNPCPCMGSWTQYLAKDDYVEIYIYITTSHGTHRYIYGDTSRKPTWWCGYLVG